MNRDDEVEKIWNESTDLLLRDAQATIQRIRDMRAKWDEDDLHHVSDVVSNVWRAAKREVDRALEGDS